MTLKVGTYQVAREERARYVDGWERHKTREMISPQKHQEDKKNLRLV